MYNNKAVPEYLANKTEVRILWHNAGPVNKWLTHLIIWQCYSLANYDRIFRKFVTVPFTGKLNLPSGVN